MYNIHLLEFHRLEYVYYKVCVSISVREPKKPPLLMDWVQYVREAAFSIVYANLLMAHTNHKLRQR